VQKAGGTAAFVDAEHALDPAYAGKLGVNIQDLLVSQPDTGEQALEITDMLVRSGAVDVVVIDSVAALTPKAEIEGEMGEMQMGLHARLMSQALRKLTGNIKRSNTMVIFINQIRMKIGVMFGNPETTTGGNALKFYASVRLDIRRIGAIKNGEEVVGNQTRVKVVKNKVAPPFKTVEFDILYNDGISKVGDILDLGVELGVIEKRGSFFTYQGDQRIGQPQRAQRLGRARHQRHDPTRRARQLHGDPGGVDAGRHQAMRRLRKRSTRAITSRVRSASSWSHFMISSIGAVPSIASSRLVTATPKSFNRRRVSSLGMSGLPFFDLPPPCLREVQRGRVAPAGVAVGLEVPRVHEVQPVVQVHLELAAAVARTDPPRRIVQERRHLARGQAHEPLEADRSRPWLLHADRRRELGPHADEFLQNLPAGGMGDAAIDQIALEIRLDEIPAPRRNHCDAQCTMAA